MRHLLGLLSRVNRAARRSRNPGLLQNPVKELSVLGRIHVLGLCSENGNSHLHQALGELDRGLPAKLHHCPVRLFQPHNALHVLGCQRLEIQLVRNVKVRTHSFRVIIDNNSLISRFCKCPGCVNRAIVKLDSLSDPNGAGAKNQHLFWRIGLYRLILASVYGIVIGSVCLKFRSAGIHHLVGGHDPIVIAELLNLLLAFSGKSSNHAVRKLDPLCLLKQLHGKRPFAQRLLHLHQNSKLVYKPIVNTCYLVYGVVIHARSKSLRNHEDSLIVHLFQALLQLFL